MADRSTRTAGRRIARRAWLLALGAGAGVVAAQERTAVAAATPDSAVIVTAARHPTIEAEAPAALSVVTRGQIEARGADNVLDAIRGEPGVTLQGRSIGGRQVIGMRGMDSRHTLFLVDGRRSVASDGVIGHSDFQYAWTAVENIDRIEVVRGPLSVLYGSDALGGVVNVITREPGPRWRLGASGEASRAEGGRGGDGQRLAAQADGPLADGIGLRAGAAHSQRDPLASAADPRISELERRDVRDGWLGLVWRPEGRHRLDADVLRGREERRADARERSGARRYHETVNKIERQLDSIGWQADWGGTAALASQLRAYRGRLDVVNERTAGVAVNPPQQLDERVLEGQLRWRGFDQDWTAGFEARNETLADPGLPDGQSTARHRALFVQDEVDLRPGLRLTAGLRQDWHDLYGQQTSPRVYLVWRADRAWTLKGGYSHGFKAPNLKQIVPGGRREGPNTVFGNPDLQPETSDGVEFGVGWQQGASQAQAFVFAQRVDNLIELRLLAAGPAPGTGSYVYENRAQARMSGLETAFAQRLGAGVELSLTYNYLDARDQAGQRLEKRPRHTAALRLDWQRLGWRAGLRVEHTADQLLPSTTVGAPPAPAPAVTLVGAWLIRDLPAGLELTLGVDNLTDVVLADLSPLFPQAEPPRTWRVALRGRW